MFIPVWALVIGLILLQVWGSYMVGKVIAHYKAATVALLARMEQLEEQIETVIADTDKSYDIEEIKRIADAIERRFLD